MSLRRLLVLCLLAGTLLAIFAFPSTGSATARLGDSPHDNPGACAACHDPSAGPAPGAVRPIEANCRSCHPDADMHPVGMRPRDIQIHEGWPLEDGVVTCATCHAEPGCDPAREHAVPYLRGGVPPRRMDFCYRCHQPTVLVRSNPHITLPPPATANDQCAACHAGLPQQGASPAESRLRLAPAEACATCHPSPVHLGVPEHTDAVLEAELSVEAASLLPLLSGGKIACWTCHDVHTSDTPTLPRRRSLLGDRLNVPAPAPQPTGEKQKRSTMLALPAADGRLCQACHGTGPK